MGVNQKVDKVHSDTDAILDKVEIIRTVEDNVPDVVETQAKQQQILLQQASENGTTDNDSCVMKDFDTFFSYARGNPAFLNQKVVLKVKD